MNGYCISDKYCKYKSSTGYCGYTGDCVLDKESDSPKMTGWICPVCGRGLSPWTSVCPCKNTGKGWEVTC